MNIDAGHPLQIQYNSFAISNHSKLAYLSLCHRKTKDALSAILIKIDYKKHNFMVMASPANYTIIIR